MNKLRLKQLRKEFNMTQEELSKILLERYNYEINKSLISRYEKGIHEPNYYFIDLASSVFGVTTDYMMGRSNVRYPMDPSAPKKIPLYYSNDNSIDMPCLVAESTSKYEYVTDDSDLCIKVSDESMSGARIFAGDLVYIKRTKDVNHGDIVAATTEDDVLIRRLLKVDNNIILHPENLAYKDIIYTKKDLKLLNILGKVKYFKAEVK